MQTVNRLQRLLTELIPGSAKRDLPALQAKAAARHRRGVAAAAPRQLTVVECRAPWREDFGPEWTRFPIARLRSTQATKLWSLHWRDRNLRFHNYDLVPPTTDIDELLAELDRDTTGIFRG